MTWNVKLFEAEEPPVPMVPGWAPKRPVELPSFGVEGRMVDDALKAAKAWLRDRGEVIRSVSAHQTEPRTLVAVVKARKREG